MMRILFSLAVACVLFIGPLAPGKTLAQNDDPVLVETTRAPDDPIWVGQRISIYLELLSREKVVGTPSFDVPTLDRAIMLQRPGSPLLGSRRIGTNEYVSRRYEFLVYARAPGTLAIPPIRARLRIGNAESPRDVSLESDSVSVEVRLPPGADPGRSLVTSTDFEVTETWDPDSDTATVGDAVTRTITVRARDVLGLALPPMPTSAPPGLRAYPSDPVTDDRSNRGQITGSRTDTTTFVCETAGSASFPALAYVWWNPDSETLDTIRLPEHTLDIAPAPVEPDAARVEPVTTASDHRVAIVSFVIGATFAILFIAFRKRLHDVFVDVRRRIVASEWARFRRCLKACRRNDARDAYACVRAWSDLPESTSEETLAIELRRCQDAIVTPGASWSGDGLAAAIRDHRRSRRHRRSNQARRSDSLNPV